MRLDLPPGCEVRVLSSNALPRIRLLVLGNEKAIVHLPIRFRSEDYESSNYAALVDDPARVLELRGWFGDIWTNSDPFMAASPSGGGGKPREPETGTASNYGPLTARAGDSS